jgi:hypothetical protein
MQLLASIEDVNTFLPPNVQISDSSPQLQVDAQRLINSQLVTVFPPATLSGWTDPAHTPEIIRAIAGRLIASKYYALLISREVPDETPGYALDLYNEAIALLAMIKSGQIEVIGPDGNPIPGNETDLDASLDVYPNDDNPMFTIERAFN